MSLSVQRSSFLQLPLFGANKAMSPAKKQPDSAKYQNLPVRDVFVKHTRTKMPVTNCVSVGNSSEDNEIIRKIEQLENDKGVKNLKFLDIIEIINQKGEKCKGYAFCNKDIIRENAKSVSVYLFDKNIDYIGYISACLNFINNGKEVYADNSGQRYAYISHINNYNNLFDIPKVASGEEYSGYIKNPDKKENRYKNVGNGLYDLITPLIKKYAPEALYMQANADVDRASDIFHEKMGFKDTGKTVYSQFDNEYKVMVKEL